MNTRKRSSWIFRIGMLAMLLLWIVAMISLAALIPGCQRMPDGMLGVNPETADTLDKVAGTMQALVPLGSVLGPFWPPAGVIMAMLGTAAAGWKQRKANDSYALTKTVVEVIQKWKELPEAQQTWKTLSPRLADAIGPSGVAVIRAIRGLPAAK